MDFTDVRFPAIYWPYIGCYFSILWVSQSHTGPESARREGEGGFCLIRGRGLLSCQASSPHWMPFCTLWQIYDSGFGSDWVPPSVPLPRTLCLYLPLCSESSWSMWDSPCVWPWPPCLLWPFSLLANKHHITHSKWEYPLVKKWLRPSSSSGNERTVNGCHRWISHLPVMPATIPSDTRHLDNSKYKLSNCSILLKLPLKYGNLSSKYINK